MAKGENIFRRRDGRWEARYSKGRELSGKIKYGYCYGKTYREAKEKVDKCKATLVPMTYSCVPIGPIPCDEVNSVFTLNSSHHSAIEIRQHLVAVLQTVGFQSGRRFPSPSGPTKRRPSLCEFF